jgi:pimeloyl-ACP methyl ester carboxylesterase
VRVVLLHALPFDGRMWRAERDLLGSEALAPSLYRFGARLEDWAQGVLDLVGGEPLVVVGCSVGGSCALEIARAAPDQVAGIVLVGAKAGVRPDPALRDRAVRLLAEHGLEAAWRAFWRPLFGRGTPADVLAEAHRLALDQDVDDVIRGVRAFHDRRDLTAFARAWPKPLVVVSGDQDRTPPPVTAAQIATTTAPRRRFHLVPDCGHYVPLENPTALHTLLAPTLAGAASEEKDQTRRS